MNYIELFLIVIGGMSLSLLAIHLWIGLIDGIAKRIKRFFRKEKTIPWHTLDEVHEIKQDAITKQESTLHESEHFHE